MERTCVKCGFVHRRAEGGADEACPACGAIYAKAVPGGALRVGQPGLAPPTAAVVDERRPAAGAADERRPVAMTVPPRTPAGPGAAGDVLAELRRGTRYPALRAAVRLAHACCLTLAALGMVGGLALLFGGKPWLALAALLGSLLLGVLARVVKEGTLVLADLGDATLRSAERQRGAP